MRCRIRPALKTWSIDMMPMRSSTFSKARSLCSCKANLPSRSKAGQTFYEGPTDVHLVGRNASDTEPARFVVVLLKERGAPILTPVKE